MKKLWAPWRMDYIGSGEKRKKCIFCARKGVSDEVRLILHRNSLSFVILNRYPYSYGHLMVAPARHIHEVQKLTPDEMTSIFRHIGKSIQILKAAFRPHGFNVGMNLGEVGGAGVLHHLHFHIIPRWKGDTNFMPVLEEVRVIPEHLDRTYRNLLPFFMKIKN